MPSTLLLPPGINVEESVAGGPIGVDTSTNIDEVDTKRSVSFAPVSNEEDINRIAIGNAIHI